MAALPAHALCTKGKISNLRKKATASSEKTWVVRKFMPFKELSRTKHWVHVEDIDAEQHYIAANSVTDEYKCLVVSASVALAYKGPDLNSGLTKINSFDRYASFEWVGRKGSWYKAKDQTGREYWFEGKNIWIP